MTFAYGASRMSLLAALSILWCAGIASSRVVCRRSSDLAFRCSGLDDPENSTSGTVSGGTEMSVIKRSEAGSAYVLCDCPEGARRRFTTTWFVESDWVAKVDGADGELIEESLEVKPGWEPRVKTHRGLLYLRRLNESTTYCLRCLCTSENRQFVSEAQCVRLADLRPGTAPQKRDWRISVVAACFAVAAAFAIAGALLTHFVIRDDASDSDVLDLIRNPISVLNLTIIHHDPPDPVVPDSPRSPPVPERSDDTSRSRRHTVGCHEPDVSVDVSARNSI